MSQNSTAKNAQIITWLQSFIQQDKYKSYPEWSGGIEECTPEEDQRLANDLLNQCAQQLLTAYQQKRTPSKTKLSKIISAFEDEISGATLDTVDREFCSEMLLLLSRQCGVIEEDIWAAEREFLLSLDKAAIEKMDRNNISLTCADCGSEWRLEIVSKDSLPAGWIVTRCFACGEIDYKSLPAGISEFRMHFAEVISELRPPEYSVGAVQNLARLLAEKHPE